MKHSFQIWKDTMLQALEKKPYRDRMRRECHELRNINLLFTSVHECQSLLSHIRSLGWVYPTNEELESIILAREDQHLYSYAPAIQIQLPKIVQLLQQSPRTRRAILQLTNFEQLNLRDDHVPSLLTAHFVFEEVLHITIHARSIDLLYGLPANTYQAATLLEHVSQKLRIPAGTITLIINSAHVFSDDKEDVQRILRKS